MYLPSVPRANCFQRCHQSHTPVKTGRIASRTSTTQVQAMSGQQFERLKKNCGKAALVGLCGAACLWGSPAIADLNKYEAAAGGEFNIGSALQYGEADIKGRDFHGQDLRRSNFTAADCRNCNFSDCKLQGAYFIKTVLAKANFQNADISDMLMDRAVLNEANLKNANLQRTVLTRSDLTGADIEGADFTNALVDRTQQMALCKYASGINSETGTDTRKSLGCGSRRAFRASQPSSSEGPQVEEAAKDAFKKTMPTYRQ